MSQTVHTADAGGVYDDVASDPARARALPARAYADLAVFAAEVERVLRGGWLPVARESQLPLPEDYLATTLASAPVLVTRDAAGALHVLSRVCRHRGMPVTEVSGNGPTLMCPYHLWRYGLDGALLSAPAMQGSDVFDTKACGLPRVRHATWGGWIFANLDGQAPDLAPQLAPLSARLAAIGPEDYVTVDVITFDSPWNWKVMVENFMESYHHIGPHGASLQHTNPGLGTYAGEGGDAFAILENPPADAEHDAFVVACVFPTAMMFFSG